MEIAREYITDEKGSVKSVVVDYGVFKAMEEALLDQGLKELMLNMEDEEEVDLSEAIALTK